MRPRTLACLVALLLGAVATAAASRAQERVTRNGQAYEEIERGRYLALVGDCAACHTAPGGAPYAGGFAVETPFGNVLAPNLTPDRDTGIGAWSDDDFVAAVRDGIGSDGDHLYPAMPYPYYARMTRADVLAIRAYLNTLEPVRHEVIANQLPFPFSIRWSMVVWNWLFFTPGTFQPVAGKSAEWNHGAYLVEGPGHCGACHTAKTILGGDQTSRRLQGGALQGWFSPNLTGDMRTGLGSWSADDVVTYLKTGHNHVSAASGPMAEVVADSTSKMSDADLRAIATYLKDQPGQQPSPAVAMDDRTRHAGEALYVDNCAACHVGDGSGIAHLFPALKGSPLVQSTDPTSLIRIVLQGAQSVATERAPTGPAMPAFGWKLSDADVAAVITYIRNSWGNAAAAVSAGDVKNARQQLSQSGS